MKKYTDPATLSKAPCMPVDIDEDVYVWFLEHHENRRQDFKSIMNGVLRKRMNEEKRIARKKAAARKADGKQSVSMKKNYDFSKGKRGAIIKR